MKEKMEFKVFTIFEHEKEQDYLRKMQNAGWKLKRVSGIGIYHFEQAAPQDVIYQLDYNSDRLKNKDEYLQMFQDCGWEHVQDYMGYSYFRKPAPSDDQPEEIFCDQQSRIEMMERVLKGRMFPLLIIFLTIVLPQLFFNLQGKRYFLAGFFGIIMLLYLFIFAVFAWKLYQYKNEKKV